MEKERTVFEIALSAIQEAEAEDWEPVQVGQEEFSTCDVHDLLVTFYVPETGVEFSVENKGLVPLPADLEDRVLGLFTRAESQLRESLDYAESLDLVIKPITLRAFLGADSEYVQPGRAVEYGHLLNFGRHRLTNYEDLIRGMDTSGLWGREVYGAIKDRADRAIIEALDDLGIYPEIFDFQRDVVEECESDEGEEA